MSHGPDPELLDRGRVHSQHSQGLVEMLLTQIEIFGGEVLASALQHFVDRCRLLGRFVLQRYERCFCGLEFAPDALLLRYSGI